MSVMAQAVTFSFVFLFLLGISFWLRGPDNKPVIPFIYWCFTQQFTVIIILAIGLLQSHLGCDSLWGDCYSRNYPATLFKYKLLIINSVNIWTIFAGIAILWNGYKIFRARK